jgi:hypothetical protein
MSISLVVACCAVYLVFSGQQGEAPVVLDALARCTEAGSTVAEASPYYAPCMHRTLSSDQIVVSVIISAALSFKQSWTRSVQLLSLFRRN